MSLRTVIRRAAVLINQAPPDSIQTGGQIIRQLVEHAKMDAEDLALRHDWPALEADRTFTTTATEVQAGAIPADFGRFAYGGDVWNRSRNERLCPLSREAWESIKAGGIGGIYTRVRIVGGKFQMVPAPGAGETIAFPYISSLLYADKTGTPKADWEADDDVCRLPENVVTLGAVWRWKAAKGFAYAEDMANYERQLALVVPAAPEIVIGRGVADGIPYAWPGILGPQA